MSPRPLLAANGGPDELFLFIIAGVCGFYLALLLVAIFYLLTLSKSLALCHPDNRTMEPGMVWLNLIPLFGFVWIFITHIRIAESLKGEYRDRGWHRRNEDYGLTLGIVSSALSVGSHAMGYCGLPFLLAGFVCWILYWVKIAGFNRQLASRPTARYDRYEDYDDREDDYDDEEDQPRRRRRARDDDDYDDRDDGRDDDRKPWERPRR